MTKPEFSEKRFTFPVFANYYIHIIVTETIYETANYLAIRDNFDSADEALRDCRGAHLSRKGHSYIFIHREPNMGTVAHESWHATYALLQFAGASLDNEVVAYHLAYIVDQIVDFSILTENRRAHDARRRSKEAVARRNRRRRNHAGSKVRAAAKVRDRKSSSR